MIEYKIRKILRNYKKATLVFDKLVKNSTINSWLKNSERLSRKDMTNRHDKLHALTVTSFSLQIFEILRETRHLEPIVIGKSSGPPYEDALIVSLTSSYCHDLARGLEKHSEKVSAILIDLLKEVGIPNDLLQELVPLIIQCAETHGGDKKASFQEGGILMLADGADCDEHRVQHGFKDVDVLRNGLASGKSPIHYFSCKAIKEVKVLEQPSGNRPLLFSFSIKGGAAAFQLEDFMKRLKNSTLESLVQVNIRWGEHDLTVWPSVTL